MDFFVNIVLVAISVLLFCCWFRYVCLLILAAETPHDYGRETADANQLSFPEVRARLRGHDFADLSPLRKCLERDFAIVTYLLDHTPAATGFDICFDEAMLKLHFRAMSACFQLTHHNLHRCATDALEEMSLVVAHLANQLGERSAAYGR